MSSFNSASKEEPKISKKSRANKGQFSIIAALLVSVILVAAVISTYSMVRHSPLQESPKVLTAIGEMNTDIKRILDFTVGYYGSILQVTGNSTYAKGLATSYLQSGLVNIARSHPEWNPSFELNSENVSTYWYTPQSYSMGNISVTYSLAGLEIYGVHYETSSVLKVSLLEPVNTNETRINIVRDNNEPELGLEKESFNFYKYNYVNSTWNLVNPENDPVIFSNGTYVIEIPEGVDPDAYSIKISDQKGIMVTAFYSQASLASGIPQYTYTFDWNATGMEDIYSPLTTDTMIIEALQNGTLRWLGHNLQLSTEAKPIPSLPVKSLHLNLTINGENQEVPYQVEDWASDYKLPLGLTSNASLFKNRNMVVFAVNHTVEKATLWWSGNDTIRQTPYAWENVYFKDDPDSGVLNNGLLELNVHNFWINSTVVGGLTSCTTEFMRINGDDPDYGANVAYVIYNGTVRDILQQESEWSNGVPNSPNLYSHTVLTLPANAPYYTYATRTIFVDSLQDRTLTDLSAIQLSVTIGTPLTENGTTIEGYPETSNSIGIFYNDSSTGGAHHWSQFISGNAGAGLMFTDTDNQNLYVFDTIAIDNTGALNVNNFIIELNPVERYPADFTYPLDVTWKGAVVTFEGEPIYPSSGGNIGLWVMVEHPPTVTVN